MTGVDDPAAGTGESPRSARLALWTFLGLQPVAMALYLALGHRQWFFFDEWDFLSARTAGSLDDLFRSHFGHWCTIPILAYRFLWAIFGLRTYWPYLALAIATHLAVAGLLRVVMRRAGVGPWLATASAAAIVFLGPGWGDIERAFQITFVGSLMFGLAQLVLADHDGRIDRRDWFGLGAGLCALMCSGVGVTMVAIVGLAVLARRGRRIAAFQVLPLAAVFTVWSRIEHAHFTGSPRPSFSTLVHFVWVNASATFGAIGGRWGIGIVFVAALVAGFVLSRREPRTVRGAHAAPVALLAGALAFAITTGISRAGVNGDNAALSRYVYVMCVLVMPAIAVSAQQLVARWRYTGAVFVGLLALATGLNFHDLTHAMNFYAPVSEQTKLLMTRVPYLPIAKDLPPSILPDAKIAPWVTVGWLRGAKASGRVPSPGPIRPLTSSTLSLRLATQVVSFVPASSTCFPVTRPTACHLQAGEVITVRGRGSISFRYEGSFPKVLAAPRGLNALAPITLNFKPVLPNGPVSACVGKGP